MESYRVIRIVPFAEHDQSAVIAAANINLKSPGEKIPLMLRNAITGWPLVQVSLFAPNEENHGISYTHVLGGGKCHDFFIGACSFAALLTRLPGKCEIRGNYAQSLDAKLFRLENICDFLRDFSLTHIGTEITVEQVSGPYGKNLAVSIPSDSKNRVRKALGKIFSFAVKKTGKIVNIGGWKDDEPYTEERINAELNHEAAIFYNGQIFVDLGCFLVEAVKDIQVYDHLASIFKVNEFRKLQRDPNFKPVVPSVVQQQIGSQAMSI